MKDFLKLKRETRAAVYNAQKPPFFFKSRDPLNKRKEGGGGNSLYCNSVGTKFHNILKSMCQV